MVADEVEPVRPASPAPGFEGERPDAASQIAGLIFALLLVDPDHRVAEANHAAENLLGKSASRLVGAGLSELIISPDARINERLCTADEALVARDIAVRTRAGEVRVNLTVSPLSSDAGWRVVTLSEVTHEDTARDTDHGATIAAPSVLAHEIKNPLAAIRGAAQLAERKLSETDRKLAKMIIGEVDRIAGLIDRMQQLGSTRADPPTSCNPHEAIRSAVATVRAAGAAVNAAEVEFAEAFDPSLPPVLANREALEQVLINLVSNAFEAASANADAPCVTVRTRYASGLAFSAVRLGKSVRLPIEITVSDNGAGIDPALRDHVFEPFVSSKKSGQGLGLALVRKLVRDMNGSISHERDKKANLTHFRIHLPKAVETRDQSR